MIKSTVLYLCEDACVLANAGLDVDPLVFRDVGVLGGRVEGQEPPDHRPRYPHSTCQTVVKELTYRQLT